MSDLLKVVAPGAIEGYGKAVNTSVDTMFTALNTLIQNVVDVDYHGTNAFAFKTEAGEKATLFAQDLARSIDGLKKGVAAATSNVSGAMGGAAIVIQTSDNSITPASPEPDTGTQIADPTALSGLVTTINSRFDELTTAINELLRLPSNDRAGWMGKARNDTETFVEGWVAGAVKASEAARDSLTGYVEKQNTAVKEQDHA